MEIKWGIVLLTLFASTKSQSAIECPSASEIFPCTCNSVPAWPTLSDIQCPGNEVTQEAIQNLFTSLRRVNNVSSTPGDGERLYIPKFVLSHTAITSLDLSPFFNTDFGMFALEASPNLDTIIPPTNSTEVLPFLFSASTIRLVQTGLTDPAISQLIRFVDKEWTQVLELENNQIDGSIITGSDLLPGLSTLTQVYFFGLSGNQIPDLGQGRFQNLTRLTALILTDNGIQQVAENALLNPGSLQNLRLRVDLSGNHLADDKIHASHGLQNSDRPMTWVLQNCQFEFISQEKFEPFLLANEDNELLLFGNNFICDARMKYLKDQRDKFESRVFGIDCTNDPGETIFTTDLVI